MNTITRFVMIAMTVGLIALPGASAATADASELPVVMEMPTHRAAGPCYLNITWSPDDIKVSIIPTDIDAGVEVQQFVGCIQATYGYVRDLIQK